MTSEGYSRTRSTRPALGGQEQLGPSLRTEIDLSICIKQTGFNYAIYTSSIFLLRLSGMALSVPDVVAANSRPFGGKLHGRISLILTFSKSMKNRVWPAGPGYRVMGIRVNSPSWPRECFRSSPAKSSSFTHPREVLEWVCLLPEEGVCSDLHPGLLMAFCVPMGRRGIPHAPLCCLPTPQNR